MNRKNMRILQEIMLKEAREEADRPAGKFDLGLWANSTKASCGTTACALGSLALSGRIAGLSIKVTEFGFTHFPEYVQGGAVHADYGAGAAVLGIPFYAAVFLFAPSEYASNLRDGPCSALEVAQRVQDLLDGYDLNECIKRSNEREKLSWSKKS